MGRNEKNNRIERKNSLIKIISLSQKYFMNILEILTTFFIIMPTLFSFSSPQISQITLQLNDNTTIMYNYTFPKYSSPFSFNYTKLLLKMETKTEVLKKENFSKTFIDNLKKEINKEAKFLELLINLEYKCPLPNNAKIFLVINNSKFFVEKRGTKLEIKKSMCEDCDIVLKANEYPTSLKELKYFIQNKKIKLEIRKNIFTLIIKGYGGAYKCIQDLL